MKNAPLALADQPFERVSKWLIARFPTPDTLNMEEALAIKLLQQLSSSLVPVEGVVSTERRNELRGLRRIAALSSNALKELGGCADGGAVDVDTPSTSCKKPKESTRRLAQLDPHPFEYMGIAVPTTDREVRSARGDILTQLRGILGVRASLFHRPTSKHSSGFRSTCSS